MVNYINEPYSWALLFQITFNQQYTPRGFAANFGTAPFACCILYKIASQHPTLVFKPINVLWLLCFMKTYDSIDSLSSKFQVSEKTFRSWIWPLGKKSCKRYFFLVSKFLFLSIFSFPFRFISSQGELNKFQAFQTHF